MIRQAIPMLALLALAPRASAQVPGGAFASATLDTHGFPSPIVTSTAIGTDGLALISYVWPATGSLKVAHCENPACSSATVTTLDDAFAAGDTALAIGVDGRGLIVYRSAVHTVRVAHCNDIACTSATTTDLDSMIVKGASASMAIGADGLGLVSYTGSSSGFFSVAHCSDIPCSAFTITRFAIGATGHAIAIGADGLGIIAYGAMDGLWGAHCNNAACSSATATMLEPGNYPLPMPPPAIAIGSDGLGLLTYTGMGAAVRVAHCQDLACTTATFSDLAGSGENGRSIAVGTDGLGLATLSSQGSVLVIHCEDLACTSFRSAPVSPGDSSSIAMGRDGHPVVSYHRFGGPLGLAAASQPPRGEFDRNGRADLLWRRDGSGDNLVWLMNGLDLTSATFTNPPIVADAAWRVVGTNDFNDDARTDLLWRHVGSGENVVWFMNGVNLVGGTFTTPPLLADVHWQVAGTDDFDRDGRPDILWRHDSSGEMVLWYMNGTVLSAGTFLTPSSLPDIGWRVGGTDDFNRDGRPDILWHHQGSGQLAVWYMNGSVLTSGTFTDPPALPDVSWSVDAVGDYNVDGRPDIVWRNQASGQTVVWLMNGPTLVSGTFTNPSIFPDTNWRLVGPR